VGRVPRPPILEDAKVVPIVFEKKLYLELKKEASRRGISVSALIRELVLKHLSSTSSVQASGSPTPSTTDPPQGVDPVVQMDIEELAEEIREVEKAVDRVKEQLEKSTGLPRNLLEFWFKNNKTKLLDTLVKAENKLKKLRYKYYSVKRKAGSSSEVGELASRMYALKSKIRELEERLK
jgi:polyhydroxyalkanoate synthesis regulator phasin